MLTHRIREEHLRVVGRAEAHQRLEEVWEDLRSVEEVGADHQVVRSSRL